MSPSEDFLLYVISASKSLDYNDFREKFNTLYLQHLGTFSDIDEGTLVYQRNRTLRILDSLGHCDINFQEGHSKVYSAPAVLARLPVLGVPQAILCGSRSPSTVRELHNARKKLQGRFDIEIYSQETRSVCIPSRIAIMADSEDILKNLAEMFQIPYQNNPPGWALAQISGSIEEYCQGLCWLPNDELNWRRRVYNITTLNFRAFFKCSADMCLSAYESPITGLNSYYLWRSGERAKVDPYFGRFAVLSSEGKNILLYDIRKFLLAVPSGAPLPRFLARAIVMCSGYAPHSIKRSDVEADSPETRGFDLYCGVPQDVARHVAGKLGQTLVLTGLHV